MEKIRFRLYFNKKKVINSHVEQEVKIKAEQKCKAVFISTNVFVPACQWNENTSEIINHPNGEAINRMLQEKMIKLEWMELERWKNGKPLSLHELAEGLQCDSLKPVKFTDLCNEYISTCNKKSSTKNNLSTTVRLIGKFRPDIHIDDMDYGFLMGFEHFLTKLDYNLNTVTKHIKHIKSFYNEAVARGMVCPPNEGVRGYKTRHTTFKYSFLLPHELETLEKTGLGAKHWRLRHSLDAFLFCCYTGMRYSDFRSLTHESIVAIDGNEWIIYRSVKTDVETRLPLHLLFNGKAIAILNKYRNDLGSFFGIKSNSSVDKDLRAIRKLSGVNTHFSFHTARHTNATLLIYRGVNITTVQKLLGHKSIRTTQHYVDVLPQGIINDLKKGFGQAL